MVRRKWRRRKLLIVRLSTPFKVIELFRMVLEYLALFRNVKELSWRSHLLRKILRVCILRPFCAVNLRRYP